MRLHYHAYLFLYLDCLKALMLLMTMKIQLMELYIHSKMNKVTGGLMPLMNKVKNFFKL